MSQIYTQVTARKGSEGEITYSTVIEFPLSKLHTYVKALADNSWLEGRADADIIQLPDGSLIVNDYLPTGEINLCWHVENLGPVKK